MHSINKFNVHEVKRSLTQLLFDPFELFDIYTTDDVILFSFNLLHGILKSCVEAIEDL